MITKKNAWLATSALISGLMAASHVMAQSTGSQQVEEVVVTAASGPKSLEGVIVGETVPKSRATITQEFIATQPVGQTVLQSLNLTPGLNFTNNDPYGSSGGNIRLRGFDGNRVSLVWDGTPLNDSGNYAVFTNQLLDPEIVDRTSVNQGTTDVDSPTASATGGTINIVTRRPGLDPSLMFSTGVGSFDYKRVFSMFDTGAIGPTGLRMFVAGSYQKYDKFKGDGKLEKAQFNARIYQPLKGADFISFAFHYNQNRNNNYRNPTMAQYLASGRKFDFDPTCAVAPLTPGVAATDPDCTNYYGRQVNPSNTGNIRGQSSFTLMEGLRLTVDPSFQYVLADGGGQYGTMSEGDGRVRGRTGTAVDLNKDGDTLDTVRFFAPSVTNTRRYGISSSLIWDLNPHHRIRIAYTLDRAKHRQTGEYTYLDPAGNTFNVFGGKDGQGPKVFTADGSWLRGRDRASVARLDQAAIDYRGLFLDDRLILSLGARNPWFTRDLNQLCYSQNRSSNVLCTTQAPNTALANGNVTFGASATEYIPPYQQQKKYQKLLPNVGASYELFTGSTVYVSYAKGLSAPRTDSLYSVSRLSDGSVANPDVKPETTDAFELGYRFNRGPLLASASIWKINFKNRIVSSFDDVLGFSVDRNVGDVKQWGVDAQVGWQPIDSLTLYGSVSYNNSELQSDLRVSSVANAVLPLKGKTLVETPTWTVSGRAEWAPISLLHLGFQGKWVDDRFSTDVNDEVSPGYTLFDADVRVDVPDGWAGLKNSFIQFNLTNVFDKKYLGSISSRTNALTIPGVTASPSAPTYNIGSPRTFQVSLRTVF